MLANIAEVPSSLGRSLKGDRRSRFFRGISFPIEAAASYRPRMSDPTKTKSETEETAKTTETDTAVSEDEISDQDLKGVAGGIFVSPKTGPVPAG